MLAVSGPISGTLDGAGASIGGGGDLLGAADWERVTANISISSQRELSVKTKFSSPSVHQKQPAFSSAKDGNLISSNGCIAEIAVAILKGCVGAKPLRPAFM